MRCREAEEDEGEEGGEAAVEDRGSDGGEGGGRPLAAGASGHEEGVADVYRVVDTQPHRQHDVDTRDDVDGDPPEVEEADDVGEGEQDCQDHQDTDPWIRRINQVDLKN